VRNMLTVVTFFGAGRFSKQMLGAGENVLHCKRRALQTAGDV